MISNKSRSSLYQHWMNEFKEKNKAEKTHQERSRKPHVRTTKKRSKIYSRQDLPESYVIADIETTGLSHKHNRIIEIAALKVINSKPTKSLSYLIKLPTGHSISPFIEELTGISNEMVSKSGVSIGFAINEFKKFISDDSLVFHNSPFDTRFLREYMDLPNQILCSLSISRQAFPDIGSHKLSFLKDCFGSKVKESHRALSDCYAVVDIINACRNVL